MNADTHTFGRLYAQPSLLEGWARVLDVGATMNEYNDSVNGAEADAAELQDDWHVVGDDLMSSMMIYEQEHQAPERT